MGSALCFGGQPDGVLIGTGTFITVGSPGGANWTNATESNRQFKMQIGGTFSKLSYNVDATGTARSLKFRKNTANGNQSAAATDTTAGIYTDNTNTDAVVSTDLVAYSPTSTGSPTCYGAWSVFNATTNHACIYACTGTTFSTASVTRYMPALGCKTAATATATIANAQFKIRSAGTFKNFNLTVNSNGRTTATVYGSNINSAAGTCTISVAASTTGLFEDTTHTDTLADGDLLCIQMTTDTGAGTITTQVYGCAIETTTGKNDISGASQAGLTRAASATVHYFPIGGGMAGTTFATTTESQAYVQHGFTCTASKARAYVSANTYTGTATMNLRKNAGNGNQSVSITASTTGWFEDATNTDSIASTDNINFSIADGTANSITINAWGLTENTGAAAAAAEESTLLMMGV